MSTIREENQARRQAQREEAKMNAGGTNGTPLQGRNPAGSGGAWEGMPAPGQRLGQRTPDRTWQQSAMDGAFGTGAQQKAQNLGARQDLYKRMQDPKADMTALQREAGGLGVTAKGWEGALDRINMGKPQPAQQPAAQGWAGKLMDGIKSVFGGNQQNQQTLAANAPPPPPSPPAAGAEPNQARYGADVARRNMTNMGLQGAVANYQSRSQEDAGDAFTRTMSNVRNTITGGTPWSQPQVTAPPTSAATPAPAAPTPAPAAAPAAAPPIAASAPAPVTTAPPVATAPATPTAAAPQYFPQSPGSRGRAKQDKKPAWYESAAKPGEPYSFAKSPVGRALSWIASEGGARDARQRVKQNR